MLWLPEGAHHGLNIRHRQLEDAGAFTGGGWKLVPHTTESRRDQTTLMWDVLREEQGSHRTAEPLDGLRVKRAAPHFVIGTDPHMRFPLVIQAIPFNRAGRALEHPSGTPETNRANAIQIEICGRTAECHQWEENWLKALANLWRMIHEAQPGIRLWNPRSFQPPVHRLTGSEWIPAHGVFGHCHAPHQTHTDPTGLRVRHICRLAQGGYHDLHPFN